MLTVPRDGGLVVSARVVRTILAAPIALLLLAFGMSTPAHASVSITGTVTEDGSPSDAATVQLHRFDGDDWYVWDSSTTDANGDYELVVPDDADPSEMFRVGFQKDGWRPEYYDNRASVDTANDVQAGDVADADLASTGRITGKVTEEGDPSDNTIVGLHRFVGGQWLYWDSVTTDMDGDYELLLPGDVGPSEVFRVGFEKYGWRTEYFDDKASVELAQDLKSGDVADADLAAAGRITGVVTEDGSPSEGVTVGAYRFDGGQWDPSVQAFTDASGAYELILPGDAAGCRIQETACLLQRRMGRKVYLHEGPALGQFGSGRQGLVDFSRDGCSQVARVSRRCCDVPVRPEQFPANSQPEEGVSGDASAQGHGLSPDAANDPGPRLERRLYVQLESDDHIIRVALAHASSGLFVRSSRRHHRVQIGRR